MRPPRFLFIIQNSSDQFTVHSVQFIAKIKNALAANRRLSTVNPYSLFTIPSVHASLAFQPPLPRFKPWPTQNTSRFSSKACLVGMSGGRRIAKCVPTLCKRTSAGRTSAQRASAARTVTQLF